MASGQIKWNAARGVYQAEYRDCAGKRRYVSDKKWKECLRKLKEAEREVDQGIHTARSETVTFGVALDARIKEWEREVRIGLKAPITVETYVSAAEKHVRPVLGSIKLNKLTAVQCQNLISDLAAKHIRVHEDVAKVLRLTLKFAVKNRWLRRSPLTDDPLLVPKRRKEVVIPSADEMARLEREIRRPNPRLTELNRDNLEAAFYIAQRATLRRGELAGLQWEHINWENGQINVQSSYTKTRYYTGLKKPKTPQGVRTVDLDPKLRAVLHRIWERQGRPRTGYVFRTRNGSPVLNTIGQSFAAAVFRAGLGAKHGKPPLTLHTLRHVCQSVMTANRVPQITCMKLMGTLNRP